MSKDDNEDAKNRVLPKHILSSSAEKDIYVKTQKQKEEEKQKLLTRLIEIKSKAALGRLSSKDIEDASQINDALGGIYSNIISDLAAELGRQEVTKRESNSAVLLEPFEIDSVALAREYLNSEEVKRSEAIFKDIELGKEVKQGDLIREIELLTKEEEREKRKYTLDALHEEKKYIFKKIISEGRKEPLPEEMKHIEEIDVLRLQLLKRDSRDMALSSVIAKYLGKLPVAEIVKRESKQIIQIIQDLPKGFGTLEHAVAKETKEMLHFVAHTSEIKKDASVSNKLSAMEEKFTSLRQEVKKEQIEIVDKVAEKVVLNEKVVDNKKIERSKKKLRTEGQSNEADDILAAMMKEDKKINLPLPKHVNNANSIVESPLKNTLSAFKKGVPSKPSLSI